MLKLITYKDFQDIFNKSNESGKHSEYRKEIDNIEELVPSEPLSFIQQLYLAKYYYLSQEYQEAILCKGNPSEYQELFYLFNKGYYLYDEKSRVQVIRLWSPKQIGFDIFKQQIIDDTLNPFCKKFI
ncbi:hypothetical protein [Niallia sp. Man26]|uniref:hypothetical protein n=1 Tax=Niallia sp. Man26 TaxID=2912824 RepID=UPI001EDB3EE6|nr:hypothetical protein [Niallia sp. Man26]UPO90744.1 hypothetical protein L8T27_022150 [Niallia sp. Man26]